MVRHYWQVIRQSKVKRIAILLHHSIRSVPPILALISPFKNLFNHVKYIQNIIFKYLLKLNFFNFLEKLWKLKSRNKKTKMIWEIMTKTMLIMMINNYLTTIKQTITIIIIKTFLIIILRIIINNNNNSRRIY
jgi:hypothetical protein